MEIVKLIRFKNTGTKHIDDKTGKEHVSKDTVRVDGLGIEVAFGAECELPEHWTRPGRMANGGRRPSPIEQVAPQLLPVDEAFAKEWAKVPLEAAKPNQDPRRAVTDDALIAALIAKGTPRGIAEQLVLGTAVEVEKG
jgi:hypothetical protein